MAGIPGNTIKDTDRDFVREIIRRHGEKPESVLLLLKAIQEKYYYLPDGILEYLCTMTQITPQHIAGVASFYSQFRQTPAGRYRIRVCTGTACHVKGAEQVLTAFKEYLNIPKDSDTDPVGIFTVEEAACLGCCMLAPAVQINEVMYGYLTPKKVPSVIRDFFASRKKAGKAVVHVGPGREMESAGEILMCTCSSCTAAGAGNVHAWFAGELGKRKLNIKLTEVGCTGLSFEAPLVQVKLPGNEWYHYGRVGEEQARYILDHHFPGNGIVKKAGSSLYSILEFLYTDEPVEPVTRYALNFKKGMAALFCGKQVHVATEHNGTIDPLDFNGYINHGGFTALQTCLHMEKKSDTIISIIKESGLRGRGGAGFPTYKKWEHILEGKHFPRYIICNGDEGDPGAFMDRMLLESFPFRIIEGMLIAGIALGIEIGFIYIRSEYPLAVERVKKGIAMCMEQGILGKRIRDTDFSFTLSVIEGAGAFVCGEETALIESVMGRRGIPHFRPPYPSGSGLYDKPTLIQNVETLAAIPWIIRKGAQAFADLGTRTCGGTKTFALAGKIARGGLIEVPMGLSLKEIVEEIGGGVQSVHGPGGTEQRVCKAVLVGGPSGGCIPAHLLNVPVDFDALQEKGAIMGSGGLVVLDNTDCMVEIARYFMAFTQSESCGKCTFCRIGTKYMLEILTRLTRGDGKEGDIEELQHVSLLVKERSLCGLGKTAPNPVLSTLTHFYQEYEAHVIGRCPAKKCKGLITYIITDRCIGCTKCAQGCPADAIISSPYEKHVIQSDHCVRCDACRQNCPRWAIKIE